MRTFTPLPDLSSWVELHEDRPPRALNVLFWGTALTTGLTMIIVFITQGGMVRISELEPLLRTVILTSVGGLLLAVLLWPLLAWSPTASWVAKAANVLFLVAVLSVVFFGNSTAFLLVCVAAMNTVAVFGLVGLVNYAALASVASLIMALAVPGDPWVVSLTYAAGLVFLVFLAGMVFVALVVASQRAEHTRALLTELKEAHEELRVRNRQVREMTLAEERARMSREMHDSTGHHLTALAMTLSNALRFRVHRPEEAWGEVEQARDLARETLDDTRRWVRALRPLSLEGLSGPEAMRELAGSFDGTGRRVDFTAEGAWPDPPEEIELVCYRAFQEGLTNAMRHSGAKHVRVRLHSAPETVTITVEDDGRGADLEQVRHGFGLRGLSERITSVNGTMAAENGPEVGFRLRAEIPVAAPAPEALRSGGGAAWAR